MRGAAEANPEIPRFARNRLRNLFVFRRLLRSCLPRNHRKIVIWEVFVQALVSVFGGDMGRTGERRGYQASLICQEGYLK